jgi:hypothetical protein
VTNGERRLVHRESAEELENLSQRVGVEAVVAFATTWTSTIASN